MTIDEALYRAQYDGYEHSDGPVCISCLAKPSDAHAEDCHALALVQAIESAYIPLVEAARAHVIAVVAQSANRDRSRVPHHEDETFATFEALTAALVQVSGQQQADTEQGGG